MPAKLGDYLGGIRTVAHLRERCRIDDITGCWHWGLAIVQGVPSVHFVLPDGTRHKKRGRAAALAIAAGKLLPRGRIAFAAACCDSTDCVNPSHCRSGTKAAWGADLARRGHLRGQAHRSLAARKATDAKGRLFSPEQVAYIRASEKSTYALAKELGVSQFAVWGVRAGRTYREHGCPNSSVFRLAA